MALFIVLAVIQFYGPSLYLFSGASQVGARRQV